MAAAKAADEEGLKRLGGGRWQTRDERFTIEPQSGTWAVLDAEQTDDLGLPLVRGPFKSLTAAKEAMAEARGGAEPTSPLKDRKPAPSAAPSKAPGGRKPLESAASKEPEEPEEPRWMRDLEPADRRRASRLIQQLTDAGVADAEGMVRRDLVGDVPAVAAFAVGRAVKDLGSEATPADVAELLAEGRDTGLGVRWRLVDGAGRPIQIDRDALEDR